MNIQEGIEALETEFNEKIKALKAEVQREDEFPQDGDEYWYIGTTGNVYDENWEGFGFEEAALEIGNVFKTKEQAEFAVEKLKVEAELRKFSRPFKDNDNNYYIELYIPDKTLSIDRSEYFKTQGTIYFESKEKAQQAIEAVGVERIKKYIFGVED
ncbi:Uncharacterised protein [Aerococcus viridans]|nr:Uncharacterised protein [Aerococcus viridans]